MFLFINVQYYTFQVMRLTNNIKLDTDMGSDLRLVSCTPLVSSKKSETKMKTQIHFNKNETSIIVSILVQKMGASVKETEDSSILPNLLKGRELEVIKWIKQIPQKAITKFNIEKDIDSVIEKLIKANAINDNISKGGK